MLGLFKIFLLYIFNIWNATSESSRVVVEAAGLSR